MRWGLMLPTQLSEFNVSNWREQSEPILCVRWLLICLTLCLYMYKLLLWEWLWYLLLAVICNSVYYLSYSYCVALPARLPATVISGRDECNPDDITDDIESIQYQYPDILGDILHHLGQ